jgi:hypothetical protein
VAEKVCFGIRSSGLPCHAFPSRVGAGFRHFAPVISSGMGTGLLFGMVRYVKK